MLTWFGQCHIPSQQLPSVTQVPCLPQPWLTMTSLFWTGISVKYSFSIFYSVLVLGLCALDAFNVRNCLAARRADPRLLAEYLVFADV